MFRITGCKLGGLLVLSIAVAACGDDEDGAGGSGGSGGQLVDQCVGDADAALVSSGALIEAAGTCGNECLEELATLFGGDVTEANQEAAASCMRDCIVASESAAGVSAECAQCYGNSAACGSSSQCVCINRTSCNCVNCLDEAGCQADLESCTGVTYDFTCTN
jgi:hypothetical protein